MIPGLLTAGNGQSWENDLVAALDRPGSAMTVILRCVDIADVLTAATTGRASAVVLSAALRRLDTEAVQRLAASGVAIVGIYPAGDDRVRDRLERIGVRAVLADDVDPPAVLAAVLTAVADLAKGPFQGLSPHQVIADPRSAIPAPGHFPDTGTPVVPPSEPAPNGRVMAVWGPVGAPGRSTVAANLAMEAAVMGVESLLVDADVYGGVLASAFGLLDESPGLAGACRQAANGQLDLTGLSRLVWAVAPRLRLLTGISRADRWPEVRPSALTSLLALCRSTAALTVIDCGFCLEADEEITFDTVAPRRNGATLAILARADVVLAVGSADPPGMERLIRGLAELSDIVPRAEPRVVLNRSRRSAAPAQDAAAALARFAGMRVTASLPEDRAAVDKAWQLGVPLADAAPASSLRKAIRSLASTVLAEGPATAAPPGVPSGRERAVPR